MPGWGRSTWGSGRWGTPFQAVLAVGIQADALLGSFIQETIEVTGIGLQVTLGGNTFWVEVDTSQDPGWVEILG